MKHRSVVVYDANVLYPAQLRDLLIRLAVAGLLRAHWSDEIHEEWMRNVLADHPGIERSQLDRTRLLMDRALPDARIEGYHRHVSAFQLPDPDDRHVMAVALEAGAEMVVTFNIRDFPRAVTELLGVTVVHPDRFVTALLEEHLEGVATSYWHVLDDGRIQCDVCPRFCKLREGQRGFCFVRACQDDHDCPSGGWEVSRWTQSEINLRNSAPFNVNRATIQKGDDRQLVYYWFEQRGRRMTSDYAAKFYTVWDSIAQGRSDGALVRVTTPILGRGGEAAASYDSVSDFEGAQELL